MPVKPKRKPQQKQLPEARRVTAENAETKMSTFIKYYKGIELVPEDEWKHFFESMFSPLPPSFRFRENHRRCINMYEGRPGTMGQAEVLREYMRTHVFPKVSDVTIDEKQFEVTPLAWYPRQLAWKCNFHLRDVNDNEELKPYTSFLIEEEKSYFISKQDVTSMIPVLLMDVKPQHKILEMCGAPGFQTAQLMECLNASNKKLPDGFLITNDRDRERTVYRWSQGPNIAFTHEDAKTYPDLYTNEDNSPDSKILYDRIFIDGPSSSDGTFRKNPNMRSHWSVTMAHKQHKELKAILRRGVELLEYNGQLVYTTNSLNPSENEAVVAAILKQAEGSLQLVDVSKRLPGLHLRPGMTSWKVMSSGQVLYDTFASCPDWFQKEHEDSLFSPLEDDDLQYHLERSVRMMPHDNDTGGCYIAVLTKTAPLPWQKEEEAMDTDSAMGPSGDAKDDKPKYLKPLRCDIAVNVCGIEWEVETTDEQLNTTSKTNETFYERSPIEVAQTSIAPWFKKAHREKIVTFQDVDPKDANWNKIKQMYDIRKIDAVPNLLHYNSEDDFIMYFFCSPVIKNLLKYNIKYFKKSKSHAGGLMVVRCKPTETFDLCPFEGHLPFMPYMQKRVIQVTRVDMITLLESKDVSISVLADRVQKDLAGIENDATVFFMYDPKGKNADPKCTIIQRRQKTDTSLKNTHYSPIEEHHNLRLCGVEPVAKTDAANGETKME